VSIRGEPETSKTGGGKNNKKEDFPGKPKEKKRKREALKEENK
jgi:hypothetical protein